MTRPLVSEAAEQTVIGGCLGGTIIADELDGLRAEDFGFECHRDAFAFISRSWAAGRPLDPFLLHDNLPAGPAKAQGIGYWAECANAGYSTHLVKAHAAVVRSNALRRQLLEAADRIAALAHAEGAPHDLAGDAAEIVGAIGERASTGKGPRLVADILREHLPAVGDRWEGRRDGLRTGFADLDRSLRGLRPGNLVLIAARPAMGKTSLAAQIAAYNAQDGAVVVFSQEMADTELVDRLIALQGRVDLSKVIGGGMDADEHDRFSVGVQRTTALDLLIDDAPAQSLADIRAKVQKIRRSRAIKLIVVDYLQLMSGAAGAKAGGNRNTEIEQISRGLKQLAKEMGCPVIALSQLSRECEKRPNKRPMPADLRDSGAIEQDADIVLMIYRDEVYNPDSPDRGTAEVLIRKNRQGPTGDVRLTWLGEYTAFGDCFWQESRATSASTQAPRRSRGFDD